VKRREDKVVGGELRSFGMRDRGGEIIIGLSETILGFSEV
jgi:hypothetical protein